MFHANQADEAFVRVGDKNKKLDFNDRLTLMYAKGVRYYEDEPVADATIADLDMDFVREYCHRIGYAKSPEEYVRENKKFVTMKDGKEQVSVAAILLQGFSTAMDEEMQEKMVHSLVGLEHAEFLKYAYAIEYDAIKTTEYGPTLELKKWPGLYIAGQICGTSGYEEAAGLGLLAGINASLKIQKKEPLILRRDQSYIGVMIDDLVTKGTEEPYRLLSSRAEFRLLLRHDNADLRLTDIGHDVGLISDERYQYFLKKKQNIKEVTEILESTYLGKRKEIEDYVISLGFNELKGGVLASELLKRQGVKYVELAKFIPELAKYDLDEQTIDEIEIIEKYEGYIVKQKRDAENHQKLEELKIPADIDYLSMNGLRLEAREKLNKVRPLTVGQASRISGVNPSDISMLILNVKKILNHE